MAGYETLKAWEASHALALAVCDVTQSFPRHERFELSSQLRRAALSAPTNLAEGRARYGSREYLRHVRIAAGSLAEVDYLLFFAMESRYLTPEEHTRLRQMRRKASSLVHRLALSLDRRASI